MGFSIFIFIFCSNFKNSFLYILIIEMKGVYDFSTRKGVSYVTAEQTIWI
jgi:hypothetical protein